MPILSQPSFGPRTALTYVTIGSLIDVWTGAWYFAFRDPSTPMSHTSSFWLVGLFLTGLTLIVLGLLLGPLGRSARKVELPPQEATSTEARIQQTAAATPRTVVPNGAGPAPAQVVKPPGVAHSAAP
jgi:hypothetical protein